MLFSGSVRSYTCLSCDRKFSSVTPTSFFPMTFAFIAATVIWSGNISQFFGLESAGLLLAFLIGAGLAFGSFFLAFVGLEAVFSGWEKNRKCPKCGGDLEAVAGGFIDGGAPSLQELLLYAIVILVPLGLALLIR